MADRVEFLEWGDRAPRSGGNGGGQQYAQPQQQSQGYNDRDNGVPEGFQAITDDDIPF